VQRTSPAVRAPWNVADDDASVVHAIVRLDRNDPAE
jgi:hypothetical protein